MGSIALQTPTVGQLNSTEDPKITSNFNTLQTVVNGNLDGTNVTASILGRRLVGQALGIIPAGTTAFAQFIAIDGMLAAPSAATAKAINAWYLDPANWTIAGKTLGVEIRASIANNSVSSGTAGLSVSLNAVTWGVSGGQQVPVQGAQAGAAAGVGNPITTGVASAASAFPTAGFYAPMLAPVTASFPANCVVQVTFQLFATWS